MAETLEKQTTVKKSTTKATAESTKIETAKKATEKTVATETKKIRVTLVKSTIGYNKAQARTCKALGLRKLNSSNELPDNPCIRGMIFKVKHLVRVEEI